MKMEPNRQNFVDAAAKAAEVAARFADDVDAAGRFPSEAMAEIKK